MKGEWHLDRNALNDRQDQYLSIEAPAATLQGQAKKTDAELKTGLKYKLSWQGREMQGWRWGGEKNELRLWDK